MIHGRLGPLVLDDFLCESVSMLRIETAARVTNAGQTPVTSLGFDHLHSSGTVALKRLLIPATVTAVVSNLRRER